MLSDTMKPRLSCIAAFVISATITRCFAKFPPTKAQYFSNALNATAVLNERWYDQDDHELGIWQSLWWNSGAIMTTLGDLALMSKEFNQTLLGIYENTYAANAGGGFLNGFYDDEGWWAMAWIKAYDVTKNTTYLQMADSIFQDLLTGTNPVCGGQWWDKEKTANNAINNNLYLAVAASLGIRNKTARETYTSDAQRQADWFLASGLINENNTIYDGLNVTDQNCTARGSIYSYNQGMAIGGLLETFKLTGNNRYIETAVSIAHGTLKHLVDENHILTDPGYPDHHVDVVGAQFKGVFARNLMYLQAVKPSDKYTKFLQNNADSIWDNDRSPDGRLGVYWQGPIQDFSAAAQGSALDCIVAAAGVTNDDEDTENPGASGTINLPPSRATSSFRVVGITTVTALTVVTMTVAACC